MAVIMHNRTGRQHHRVTVQKRNLLSQGVAPSDATQQNQAINCVHHGGQEGQRFPLPTSDQGFAWAPGGVVGQK